MALPFYIVASFTTSPLKGNPAGVILNADVLSNEEMQRIASELQCSETAFVFKSERADYKLRYFSPLKEVDLCGHATIATFHVMMNEGLIRDGCFKVETKAGMIGIEIKEGRPYMEQMKPVFKEIHTKKEEIAKSLGIDERDIADLPIEASSTGLFSLNIPIRTLDAMKRMQPDFEKIKEICLAEGIGSFFLFTFETIRQDCFIHARCFAPLYGVNEDPVTGTANGACAAYLKKHDLLKSKCYKAEQGCEIGRDGIVYVEVNDRIKVGGDACIVMKGKITD